MEQSPSEFEVHAAEGDVDLDWNQLDKRKFFFFGATMFFGVRAIVYPAGLMKTRMQVHKRNDEYFSLKKTFHSIKKNEGFFGFYRGFATTAFGIIPAQGLYLSSYEISKEEAKQFFRDTYNNDDFNSEFKRNLFAGMVASVSSQFVIVPIDVVAQRLMIQGDPTIKKKVQFENARHVVRHTLKHEGVRGLYRGFFSSLLTYAPSSGIWWATYAVVKRGINEKLAGDKQIAYRVPVQAISGLTSGVVAAVLTNPMDVLKVRAQVQDSGPRLSIRRSFVKLIQEEGIKSMGNGLSAKICSSAPVSVLMITVYELVKRLSMKEE